MALCEDGKAVFAHVHGTPPQRLQSAATMAAPRTGMGWLGSRGGKRLLEFAACARVTYIRRQRARQRGHRQGHAYGIHQNHSA